MTKSSSANGILDISAGFAYIELDFDSLSEENKKIAQQYGKIYRGRGGVALSLIIPIDSETTPQDISDRAMEIAHSFKKQQATWIPTFRREDYECSPAELKRIYVERAWIAPEMQEDEFFAYAHRQGYLYDPNKEVFSSKDFLTYYYDPNEGLYYYSEEHYKKAKEEIPPQ